MSNLRAALVEAVYDAVNVAGVTALAPVYQHMKQDTQPPFVVIQEASLSPEGGKDGGLYRAKIVIVCLYRGTKGTEAAAIVDAVEAALLNGTLAATGMLTTRAFEIQSDGPFQGEDGKTYEGTVTAEALVQPS